MTPAERAVIDAARTLANSAPWGVDTRELRRAIAALDAEDHPAEEPRPWAEVVTEDEVFSEITGKWYRVLSTELKGNPVKIEVYMEGVKVPFLVEPGKPVPVRRSDMGRAVDVWTQVMKSGPADA